MLRSHERPPNHVFDFVRHRMRPAGRVVGAELLADRRRCPPANLKFLPEHGFHARVFRWWNTSQLFAAIRHIDTVVE